MKKHLNINGIVVGKLMIGQPALISDNNNGGKLIKTSAVVHTVVGTKQTTIETTHSIYTITHAINNSSEKQIVPICASVARPVLHNMPATLTLENGKKLLTGPVMVAAEGREYFHIETKNTIYHVTVPEAERRKPMQQFFGRLVEPVELGKPAKIFCKGNVYTTAPVKYTIKYASDTYIETESCVFRISN